MEFNTAEVVLQDNEINTDLKRPVWVPAASLLALDHMVHTVGPESPYVTEKFCFPPKCNTAEMDLC